MLDVTVVVVEVEVDKGDDDDDDSMISDEVKSTESERGVVELPVLGVGVSPTVDTCKLAATVGVVTTGELS